MKIACVSELNTIYFCATRNFEKMKFLFDVTGGDTFAVREPTARLSILASNVRKFSLMTFSSAALGLA